MDRLLDNKNTKTGDFESLVGNIQSTSKALQEDARLGESHEKGSLLGVGKRFGKL